MGLAVDILLAAVCLAIGVLHLGTASGRGGEAVAHGVMGLGMAAMFVPAADPLPRPVWVGVFAVLAAWAAVAAVRERSLSGHGAHHLVGAAAMLFMVLTPHHHGAAGPAGSALLLAVVALAFTAWFVADVTRALATPRDTDAPRSGRVGLVAWPTLPSLLRPARIVMSGAMAVMLVAA